MFTYSKDCKNCFKSFSTNRRNRLYCSDKCRYEAWTLRQQAERCFYCGEYPDTIDHVPPRAYRGAIKELDLSEMYPELEVNACRDCNLILGARPFWTLRERKRFVKKYLAKKYRRILSTPDEDISHWSTNPRELLQQFALKRELIKRVIRRRLSY